MENCQIQIPSLTILQQGIDLSIKSKRREGLIEILSKLSVKERTEKDNRLICEILKNQDYFKILSGRHKIFMDICSMIEYVHCRQKQIIYNVNDIAQSFYWIITGQVILTIPQKVQLNSNQNIIIKQIPQFKKIISNQNYNNNSMIVSRIENSNKSKILKKSYIQRRQSLMYSYTQKNNDKQQYLKTILDDKEDDIIYKIQDRIVKTVVQGQCFGEITAGEINRRATNAVVKQQCHMIVIRKKYYDYIKKAQLNTQMKLRYCFLLPLPLFSLIHRYSIEGFIYYLEKITCSYNSVLYSQGQIAKYIYIIRQGSFKLYKNIEQDSQYRKKAFQEENQLKISHKRKNNYAYKIIQNGQILCDAQSFYKIKKYEQTCICQTQYGIVYRMQRKIFVQKLLSTQNNLKGLEILLCNKMNKKYQDVSIFLSKYYHNDLFMQYLPTNQEINKRQCRIKKQVYTEPLYDKNKNNNNSNNIDENNKYQKYNNNNGRNNNNQSSFINSSSNSYYTSNNNYDRNRQTFYSLNENIKQIKNNNRISIHRKKNNTIHNFGNKGRKKNKDVPATVNDIVKIVHLKTQYSNLRKVKTNELIFEFDMKKVPIYIKQKCDYLIPKIQSKK